MSKPETKTEVVGIDDDDMPDSISAPPDMPHLELDGGSTTIDAKASTSKEEVKGLDDEDDSEGDPEFVTLTCGKHQFKVKTQFAKVSGLVKDQIKTMKADNVPLDKFIVQLDQTQHMPEIRDGKTGKVTREAFEAKAIVDTESTKNIVKWMNLVEGASFKTKIPKPAPNPMKGKIDGLPDSVFDFIEQICDPLVSTTPILNLVAAANFMAIPDLVALSAAQVGQYIGSTNPKIAGAFDQRKLKPEEDQKERTTKKKKASK
jgi:hypothetical protein